MKKRCFKACEKFIDHFGYCAAFPEGLDFDQDEYADELLKCIEDDFDYTIEKYGTKVPEKKPYPTVFID